MTDDRRRAADAAAASITPGQDVGRRDVDLGSDETLDMPAATPEPLAEGSRASAGRAGTSAASKRPDAAELGLGSTHGVGPSGTLDLPASDRVDAADALAPGQMIGHFVIRARLGEGGMGVVLSAHDADLGRPVAIKLVKHAADHPAYRARLLREAQVMARLEHPNVVRVYEVGSDRGRLFVAMELVDGVTLGAWLAAERRPWRAIVAMFEQVGAGLAAVHRAGLVHRDFKPDNVLVDRAGRARVADFGLARLDPDSASETTSGAPEFAAALTRTGAVLGTPAYMAPEQHFGGAVDARADQYSFCIALREALVGGRRPTNADADWGEVPHPVRSVVARGLAVDAAERFASMDELLATLARAHTRGTVFARRAWLRASAAVLVLAGGVTAAVVITATDEDRGQPRVVSAPASGSDSRPASGSAERRAERPADATTVLEAPGGARAATSSPAAAPSAPGLAVASAAPSTPEPAGPATAGLAAGPSGTSHGGGGASANRTGAPAAPSRSASRPTPAAGDTVVTPMEPVPISKAAMRHNVEKKPVRTEMIAAHRPAVREAVRGLAYGGVEIVAGDREADLAELRDKLAAATDDLERGVFLYAMGQLERFHDDCLEASKHWRAAKKLILAASQATVDPRQREERRNQSFRFYGRVTVAEGMCALTNGRALGTDEVIRKGGVNLFGVPDVERAHVWFAMGIAMVETGDPEGGKALILQAARYARDAKLDQTIMTYARAVGLTLP